VTGSEASSPPGRPGSWFSPILFGAFALVFLLFAASLGAAVVSLKTLTLRQGLFFTENYLHSSRLVERSHSRSDQMAALARGYLLTGDPAFLDRLDSVGEEAQRDLDELRSVTLTAEEREVLRQVQEQLRAYHAAALAAGKDRTAVADLKRLEQLFDHGIRPAHDRLVVAVTRLHTLNQRILERARRDLHNSIDRTVAIVASFALGALGVGLFVAIFAALRLRRDWARQRDAVSARNQMLAVVAHDLRSPLAAILMGASLLRRNADPDGGGGDGTRGAAPLKAIERSARRMERMVRDLLDAESIDAGHLAIATRPCEPAALLESVREAFAPMAAEQSIALQVVAPPARATGRVMADPERVFQVLSNLVGNALKFVPGGGTVILGAQVAGHAVRLSVADNGPGIAPDDLQRVFDRYWQAHRGGRTGAGLGLHIARGIVERHGGRISVQSQLGHGTTFCVTLPRVGPGGPGGAGAQPPTPSGLTAAAGDDRSAG
jgi:signal transduction histidine kinase